MPYYTILFYVILYCIVPYCTVLYFTILYNITLLLLVDWISSREPRARQGACARQRMACRSHMGAWMIHRSGCSQLMLRGEEVDSAQALWIAYGSPQCCPRCVPTGTLPLWGGRLPWSRSTTKSMYSLILLYRVVRESHDLTICEQFEQRNSNRNKNQVRCFS